MITCQQMSLSPEWMTQKVKFDISAILFIHRQGENSRRIKDEIVTKDFDRLTALNKRSVRLNYQMRIQIQDEFLFCPINFFLHKSTEYSIDSHCRCIEHFFFCTTYQSSDLLFRLNLTRSFVLVRESFGQQLLEIDCVVKISLFFSYFFYRFVLMTV